MKKAFFKKLLTGILSLSLLLNSASPFLYASYAEESEQPVVQEQVENTTPTQEESAVTPTPEEQVQPPVTETPAFAEEVTPSPSETENVFTSETFAPAEEISPTPSENVTTTETQTPSEVTPTVLENQENNNSPNEELSVVLLDNVSADSLNLGILNLETAGNDASATLITDKTDYAPTDTALISGSNLLPNTTYALRIWSDDEPSTEKIEDVQSNENGSFVYAYQLDGTYRPNYTVELKDSEGNVVATTAFTDAATGTLFPNGQGFYTAWTGDEDDIDETGTPDCEDNHTDGDGNGLG